jgi:LSD1 subclass zinc finger protein
MKVTGGTQGGEILVELKYCERCGGLWLRPEGTSGVFCASCQTILAAMPDPDEMPALRPTGRRRARMPKGGNLGTLRNPSRIDGLQGVAATEVWA